MDKPTQALSLVANGDSIDQAADNMNLSRSSVEKYLVTIRERLSAKNLIHAVHLATKSGLIIVVIIATTNGNVDMLRRRTRPCRREQYTFLMQQEASA